jgi:RimJ/RimL family protein N-acetyltransferase
MVAVAREAGIRRLYALCHHEHAHSAHVLEKCDFAREDVLRAMCNGFESGAGRAAGRAV